MTTRTSTWWRAGLALAGAAWWLRKVVAPFPSNQWDFRVYYFAAQAWRSGLNPYEANLSAVAGSDVLPFVYPPYTLGLFALFTPISLEHALFAFLAIKLALLAGLIVLWSRLLRTSAIDPAWVLFLLLGYASCIFVDFTAGNVTIFEQALVWLGIAALFRQRYWLFVTLVVAASLFKLTPIALLALCAVIPRRQGLKMAAAGLAMFGIILATTYVASPDLTAAFIRLAVGLDERGHLNPSALAFVRDSADLVGRHGLHLAPLAQWSVYAAVAATVIAATWMGARWIFASGAATGGKEAFVYLVLLAFAVVQPRFKNYSYILVLVPTYYVATRSSQLKRAVPLLILACIPAYTWITRTDNVVLIANYTCWFIVLGAWALALYELRSGALLKAEA